MIIRYKYEIKRLSLFENTDNSLQILQTFLFSDTIQIIINDVKNITNPKSLFGKTFNIVYKDKKYHSGIIWKGVSRLLTST